MSLQLSFFILITFIAPNEAIPTKNDTRTTAHMHGPESSNHSEHGSVCYAKETQAKHSSRTADKH